MHPIDTYTPRGKGEDLTPELIEHIISFVPNVYVIKSVAILAGISATQLAQWMTIGEIDYNDNLDTLYAQLWRKYNSIKYNDSKRIVASLKGCPRNYGALTFILERCFADEFEQETDTMKQLKQIVFTQIAPLLNRDYTNAKQINFEDNQTG